LNSSNNANITYQLRESFHLPQSFAFPLPIRMSAAQSSSTDPAVQQLRIPKEAISELEQLVSAPITKKKSYASLSAPKVRFYTAILMVITFGIVCLIINCASQKMWSLGLVVGLIVFEWTNLYSDALSHRRRAFFNVRNVLQTYQPRARTHGHLFQPEPDTPKPDCCPALNTTQDRTERESPMKAVGQAMINEMGGLNEQSPEFNKSVHSHYAGMYENIKRINSELALLDKANKANEELGVAHSDAAKPDEVLVPADLPLPDETLRSRSNSLRKDSLRK